MLKNNLIPLSILFIVISCSAKEVHPIVGSWFFCERDGSYSEYKITEDFIFYSTEIIWEPIGAKIEIKGDTLYAPHLNHIIAFKIQSLSKDSLVLNGETNMLLVRMNEEIPEIDSTQLEIWLEQYQINFNERAKRYNGTCPDLRTEQELLLDTGVVNDTFVEIDEEYVESN